MLRRTSSRPSVITSALTVRLVYHANMDVKPPAVPPPHLEYGKEEYYDSIPDPDAEATEEEKAAIVCPLRQI